MEYPFKDLMPLDEATARDGYYKDWTHIDADTFHQISELVKFIREKGYGADTREAIAQALERVYHDAIESGHVDMEISKARKNFKDLAARLDASDQKLNSNTAQLAQKANQSSLVQTNTTVSGLDQRIDNLVIPISAENANVEVTDSHVSVAKGKTFDSLTNRLEESEEDFLEIKNGSLNSEMIVNYLPNGVADEFNGDFFTKRTKTIVLNGSHVKGLSNSYSGLDTAILEMPSDYIGGAYGTVGLNILLEGYSETRDNHGDKLGKFWVTDPNLSSNTRRIYIGFPVGTFANSAAVSPYFNENNIKAIYQLAQEETLVLPDNMTANTHELVRLGKNLTDVLPLKDRFNTAFYQMPLAWEKLPNYDTATKTFTLYGGGNIYVNNIRYNFEETITIFNDKSTSELLMVFNTNTESFYFKGYTEGIERDEVIILTLRHYAGLKAYGKGILDFTIDGKGGTRTEENELSDYEVNEIGSVNDKVIESKQRDTLSFAFITDTHADGGIQGARYKSIKQYIKALVEFSKYGQVDFLAHGGDVTSGAEALWLIKWKYSDLAKRLNESDLPVLPMLGNHDDNSYYTDSPNISHIFRKDDMVKRFMLNFQNGGVHDSQNAFSGYYYKDFKNKKVRVVTLDAIDYQVIDLGSGQLKYHGRNYWGYGARQVDWLAHEALSGIPAGYKVIVLSHMPTRHQHTGYPEATGLIKNGQFIEEVLKACHTGGSYIGSDTTTDYGADVSVDFTEQGTREILLYAHGHNHSDTVYDNTLPYPIVGTQCAYTDPTKTGMVTGTATETAWDVFNVHVDTGTIDVFRYGYGDDRVV